MYSLRSSSKIRPAPLRFVLEKVTVFGLGANVDGDGGTQLKAPDYTRLCSVDSKTVEGGLGRLFD